jgi:succinate-semialdehyde dehydrogenase/glutarate-semialdehyde dehydrogenase
MAAAAGHPIPVCMELGGVDAAIVLEDADVELAASAIVWGAFFNGGQVCASIERLLVHESIRERLLWRVVDKARALEPATDLGRATVARQRQVYEEHLADARARGLALRCGGSFLSDEVLAPTVVEGDGIRDAHVYREESFGPILAVHSFRSDDEAVRLHDELWGGLTASIFSRDHSRARAMAERLDTGLVAIEDVAATLHALPELPWGGVGISGFGRSHGREGLLEFSRSKTIDSPRIGLRFKRPWWFPYGRAQHDLIAAYVRAAGERHLGRRLRALGAMGRSALRLFLWRPRL